MVNLLVGFVHCGYLDGCEPGFTLILDDDAYCLVRYKTCCPQNGKPKWDVPIEHGLPSYDCAGFGICEANLEPDRVCFAFSRAAQVAYYGVCFRLGKLVGHIPLHILR